MFFILSFRFTTNDRSLNFEVEEINGGTAPLTNEFDCWLGETAVIIGSSHQGSGDSEVQVVHINGTPNDEPGSLSPNPSDSVRAVESHAAGLAPAPLRAPVQHTDAASNLIRQEEAQ